MLSEKDLCSENEKKNPLRAKKDKSALNWIFLYENDIDVCFDVSLMFCQNQDLVDWAYHNSCIQIGPTKTAPLISPIEMRVLRTEIESLKVLLDSWTEIESIKEA